MQPQFPKKITVLIDRQEQRPLEFPGSLRWWSPGRKCHLMLVVPRYKVHLRTGDYAISGYEKVTLAERKGAWSELVTNLFTDDRPRFIAAFDRLADECRHPVLLLDMPTAVRPNEFCRCPDQVIDGICAEAIRRGITILWSPPSKNPTRTGELLLRWMWQAVYEERYRYRRSTRHKH